MNDKDRTDAARVQLEQAADRLEADIKAGVFCTGAVDLVRFWSAMGELPSCMFDGADYVKVGDVLRVFERARLANPPAAQIVADARRIAELEASDAGHRTAYRICNDLHNRAVNERDAANALLERLNTWNETEGSTECLVRLCEDTAGHLSGQPAVGCADCGANTFEPHRAGCQPAAPTRTEAEQAVLDVVRRWVDGEVTSVGHIAAAEHARRGVT